MLKMGGDDMKTNLILICQFPKYNKAVAKLLSDKLDMFFVDIDEMIDYELSDLDHIMAVLGSKDGKKYIKEQEVKVVKNIASYENTIITTTPQFLFADKHLSRMEKTCYIIYLQIAPKFFKTRANDCEDCINEALLSTAFTERDKLYTQSSDIVINCSSYKPQKATKKIAGGINSFFKKLAKESKKLKKSSS